MESEFPGNEENQRMFDNESGMDFEEIDMVDRDYPKPKNKGLLKSNTSRLSENISLKSLT